MSVDMKHVTTTNRNQCVPDIKAGEAVAIHINPNNCNKIKYIHFIWIFGIDWYDTHNKHIQCVFV